MESMTKFSICLEYNYYIYIYIWQQYNLFIRNIYILMLIQERCVFHVFLYYKNQHDRFNNYRLLKSQYI